MTLSLHRLRELLTYCEESGRFVWNRSHADRKAGDTAGHLDYRGYVRIGIDNKLYRAHRLVWFYVHGETTNLQIDHINGNRCDNRIANLRCVVNKENAENQKLRITNSSGFRGVSWNKSRSKWHGYICHHGSQITVGFFDDVNSARDAVRATRDKLYTHHKTPYSA